MVSALAVLLAGCGGRSAGDLYDAEATRNCLQNRPEYVGPLPADAGTAPTRTVLYVSAVRRDVAEGTERVDLFFDGPADETVSQLQTPSLFFYPDVATARRRYRAQVARLDDSLRKMFGIGRNVGIRWERPDVPQQLRAIVRGCLRP